MKVAFSLSAASAVHTESKNQIHGPGTTTLIIPNEEMNCIKKIVQALKDSNIFSKGVTKTIRNKIKEQKGGSLSMLLENLGASLLGNLLSGKAVVRTGSGNKKRKEIVMAGTGKK